MPEASPPALPLPDYAHLTAGDVCTILDFPQSRLSQWFSAYPSLHPYTKGEFGQTLPRGRMRWTELTLLRLAIFAALAHMAKPVKNKALVAKAADLAARSGHMDMVFIAPYWDGQAAIRVDPTAGVPCWTIPRTAMLHKLRLDVRAYLAAQKEAARWTA